MQDLLKLALEAGKVPERIEGGGWELSAAAFPAAESVRVYTRARMRPCMDSNGLPEQRPGP